MAAEGDTPSCPVPLEEHDTQAGDHADIGVQSSTESTEVANTDAVPEGQTEGDYQRRSTQPSVSGHGSILDFIRNGEQAMVISATVEVTDMLMTRLESGATVDAGNISVKAAILTRGAER